MDQPTVRDEDIQRAMVALRGLGQQLAALHAAIDTVTLRFNEALAVVVNASGGPTVAGSSALNVQAAANLGVLMANDIIDNRPQDAGMEFDVAQALWDNPRAEDDTVLLASYLSTLREYVNRGRDDA